jgi:hypothetical protein
VPHGACPREIRMMSDQSARNAQAPVHGLVQGLLNRRVQARYGTGVGGWLGRCITETCGTVSTGRGAFVPVLAQRVSASLTAWVSQLR